MTFDPREEMTDAERGCRDAGWLTPLEAFDLRQELERLNGEIAELRGWPDRQGRSQRQSVQGWRHRAPQPTEVVRRAPWRLPGMSLNATRRERRALAADNRREPKALRQVPESEWPSYRPTGLAAVWRSREFLVQVFTHESAFRLSVCRTQITGNRWTDGISWDDLQRVKRECGLGDKCAVELFPPDGEVVNVANMRHLWIVDAPPFMWRGEQS